MAMKQVEEWECVDVLAWLAKIKRRMNSAEALQVYVDQKRIDGQTLLGYTKDDASQFGLISKSDFGKILDKLHKEDANLKKEQKKKQDKDAKVAAKQNKGRKPPGGNDYDSGVESESFSEAKRTILFHDGSQPSSANTSGDASFAPSGSGGSTHMNQNNIRLATEYEDVRHFGGGVEEATYIAPEDVHRTSSGNFEPPVITNRPEGVISKGSYSYPNYPNAYATSYSYPNEQFDYATKLEIDPVLAPPPSRPAPTLDPTLPHLYPTLTHHVPGVIDYIPADGEEGTMDDMYMNNDVEDPDQWDEDAIYMNAEAEPEYEEEDEHDDEQMYLNIDEAQSTDAVEADKDDNLAEIQRKLTLVMRDAGKGSVEKKSLPSRPPMVAPQHAAFLQQKRRPVEPPKSFVTKPDLPPSRLVTSPAPEEKPSFQKRTSVPAAPSTPIQTPAIARQATVPHIPQKPASAGLSIKDRMAMFSANTNEPGKETENALINSPKPRLLSTGGGGSVKNMADLLGGKLGGPRPGGPTVLGSRPNTSSPPLPPPPGIRSCPSPRPTSPPAAQERQPLSHPVSSVYPAYPGPGPSLPPPPPNLMSIPSDPAPNQNKPSNYEDVTIQFPTRAPLPPPPGSQSSTIDPGPGDYDDDDDNLYTLEDEDFGPEDIYTDETEMPIPGYQPHVKVRKDAEDILKNDPRNTCFLIRDSSADPNFPHVISLKSNGNYEHTRLGARHNGTIAIGTPKPGEVSHESLADLVRYHSKTPLNLRGRNVLLRNPIGVILS